MKIPLVYKLGSLEFRNGLPQNQRRLGFRRATIEHDSWSRTAIIDGVDTPDAAREQILAKLMPFELWTIRYEMQPEGFPPITFCHPFRRGEGVYLYDFITPTAAQKNQMFLRQAEGKLFFSNDFTLEGVSQDTIPSNQRVFQFHE